MDLVVAGTDQAVLMVESEADQLSEEVMLGAVVFGHEQMQVAINAIEELVEAGGKPEWEWKPADKNHPLIDKIAATNDDLNAFVHLDEDLSRQAAEAVDAAVARGEDPGPLAGVPFGVKDLDDCAGMPTSHGSLLF